MPDIYIPQLQDAWRKDLVDLYKSGEEAKLKNLMDGYSVLKEMTEDYLLLQTTERTVIEMKLLPIEKGTNIICMITTFSAPVSDSKIDFFTIDWNPLPTEDFFTPPAKELFLKKVKGSDAEIKKNTACLDIDFIQYGNANAEAASNLEIVVIVTKAILFIGKRPAYIRSCHKVDATFSAIEIRMPRRASIPNPTRLSLSFSALESWSPKSGG